MTADTMTSERFLQILSAYGAEARRWPEAERDAATTYAERNPELIADALAQEAQLDALLGNAERKPSELLERRLLSRMPVPAGLASWRAPVAAAAALLIGVCIGFASGAFTAPVDDPSAMYADAFSGLDEDWIDWLESGA
jgi:ABC-type dipeptide/oligopeptide/nickel transport system permease subunit